MKKALEVFKTEGDFISALAKQVFGKPDGDEKTEYIQSAMVIRQKELDGPGRNFLFSPEDYIDEHGKEAPFNSSLFIGIRPPLKRVLAPRYLLCRHLAAQIRVPKCTMRAQILKGVLIGTCYPVPGILPILVWPKFLKQVPGTRDQVPIMFCKTYSLKTFSKTKIFGKTKTFAKKR